MQIIKQLENGVIKTNEGDAISSDIVAERLGVSHRNLMRNIKKVEKMQNVMCSELSALKKDFHPIFKKHYYIDVRGRKQNSRLMNEDAVFALIKTINTQEAYNYFAILVSEFKTLRAERLLRETSKKDTLRYTDKLKELYALLKKEGSKQPENGFYATVQRKVYKCVTGAKMSKGGVNHDALTELEDIHFIGVKNIVIRHLEEYLKDGNLTGREIRKKLYNLLDSEIIVPINATKAEHHDNLSKC